MYFNKNVSMEKKPEKVNAEFPINKINLYTAIPIVLMCLGLLYLIAPITFVLIRGTSQMPSIVCSLLVQIITIIWFVWQVKNNRIPLSQIFTKPKRAITFLPLILMQISDWLFFTPLFMYVSVLTASESTSQIFLNLGQTELALWSINAIIFTPIAEEIVFRLIIMNKIKIKLGAKWAIIISSVLFSLFHIRNGWENTLHALFLGFFYSILYEYTGSLKASTIMHAINNSIVVLSIYIFKSFFEKIIFSRETILVFTLLLFTGGIYIIWFFIHYSRILVKSQQSITEDNL